MDLGFGIWDLGFGRAPLSLSTPMPMLIDLEIDLANAKNPGFFVVFYQPVLTRCPLLFHVLYHIL